VKKSFTPDFWISRFLFFFAVFAPLREKLTFYKTIIL